MLEARRSKLKDIFSFAMKNKATIFYALSGFFILGIFAVWHGTALAVVLKPVYDTTSNIDDRDIARDIVVGKENPPNAYVIGHTYSGGGGILPDLVRYDSAGVAGPAASVLNAFESIALSPAGDYLYIAGGEGGVGLIGTIAKYDTSLNFITSVNAAKVGTGTCDQHSDINGIAVDSTGVYVVGTYVRIPSCSASDGDFWLMKFNLDLTGKVDRFYNSGATNEEAYGVAVDAFQNAYVIGRSGSNTWTVVRFNADGSAIIPVDASYVPGRGARDVAVDTASGYIYAVGEDDYTGHGITQTRIVKYASSSPWTGWVVTSRPQGQSSATGVALDKFGNVYISLLAPAGSPEGGVQKFNSSGELLFTSTFTGMCAESVAVDDILNFYMTGKNKGGACNDDFGFTSDYRTQKILQLCNGTSSLTNYEIPWTDDPIIPNVTKIRATHITELRQWIDNRWNDATSTPKPYSWGNFPPLGSSDAEIIPGQTKIRAGHINELRDILSQTFSACNATAPGLAGVDATTTISASQIKGLRDFTKSVPSLPQ